MSLDGSSIDVLERWVTTPVVTEPSAPAAVIADFAAEVRSGRPPLCDGRDGTATLAVVEATYAAARTGGLDVRGPLGE